MKYHWIVAFLLLSVVSCKTQKDLNIQSMNDYDKEWKAIDRYVKEGFPEQASVALDSLIQKARGAGDELVATRAVLEKMNLKNLDQQDFMAEQLTYLKDQLEIAESPLSKSFLNYTIALIYQQYWQNNRGTIVQNIEGEDRLDGQAYHDLVNEHFELAINDEVKEVKLSELDGFFLGENHPPYASYWDFLVIERIRSLQQRKIGQIDNTEALDKTIDSLYENFVAKLKDEGKMQFALEVDIERHLFLQKDLSQLSDSYPAELDYVLIYHEALKKLEKARQLEDKDAKSTLFEESYDNFKSLTDLPDTIYAANARTQVSLLEQKELQVLTEQVLLPNQPSLVYVNAKNVDKIFLKIYRLDKKDYLEERIEKGFQFRSKTIVHEDEINLPEAKYPFVNQSTEIELPALEPGFYGIAVNTNNDFSLAEKSPLFQGKFLVSNLTLDYHVEDGRAFLQCLNRKEGQVIKGASFAVYKQTWGNRNGAQLDQIASGIADSVFSFVLERERNVTILVEKDGHFFMLKNNFYGYAEAVRTQLSVNILTDRAIYRPGQIIYFHGMVTQINKDLIPQKKSSMKLQIIASDNFGNEVGKLDFVTDQYGSFNGTLPLPEEMQNGSVNLRISADNQFVQGFKSVRIEEYKRPKFAIEFADVEHELKLGESVQVEATANSYTGIPVQDAKVSYKIYRSAWWPYFYGSYSIYRGSQQKSLVESGETSTDNAGNILFSFTAATSDENLGPKSYSYSIELDVTDRSGETISATKVVQISEQSVFVKIDQKENGIYSITTVNSENQFIPAAVDVMIMKKASSDFAIERYWPFPETNVVDITKFPDYRFQEKKELYDQLAFSEEYNLEDTLTLNLKEQLGAGDYLISVKTKESSPVEQFVEVVNFVKNDFPTAELFYIEETQSSYAPGDQFNLKIGSAVPIQVKMLRFKNMKVIDEKWLDLNETEEISKLITEEDYGGFSYSFRAFYKNRSFEKIVDVVVPWQQKKLTIKPKTIRKITEPGAEEKWTFIVMDAEGNPVRSQLLASMYDASLDQFQDNTWSWKLYPELLGVAFFDQQSYGGSYLYTSNYQWNQVNRSFQQWLRFPSYKYRPQQFYNKNIFRRQAMRSEAPEAEMSVVEGNNMSLDEFSLDAKEETSAPETKSPNIRRNLSELVFFKPTLSTNENGEVDIEFTNNEALTSWIFQTFAYTEDLKIGFIKEEIITRKELMIQANQPRFLRSGDVISLSAKLINLSEADQMVTGSLVILDAFTNEPLDMKLEDVTTNLKAGEQKDVAWSFEVPQQHRVVKLIYQVSGENHDDAEEHTIPIMPDEIYLIDSKTVLLDPNEMKEVQVGQWIDESMRSDALTIETTGSPAWYAMRALPYLMEQDEENSESIFNRLYANTLALQIIEENPLIEQYYEAWREKDQLNSKLKINEVLQSIDLTMTPWLQAAENEEETMKKMAKLFQKEVLEAEILSAKTKLAQFQYANGAFPWYSGGRPNLFISQYILEGMLRMEDVGLIAFEEQMKERLLQFCNQEIINRYNDKEHSVNTEILKNIWINGRMGGKLGTAHTKLMGEWKDHLQERWFEYGLMDQVYISRIFNGSDAALSKKVARSLYEKSFYKEELGRFWNSRPGAVYSSWDISLQAKIIELFDELNLYPEAIQDMKFWLISNKRSNSWSTTIATSSAIHALSLGESSSFVEGKPLEAWVDNVRISEDYEKGVNYSKTRLEESDKIKAIKEISFKNPNGNRAWANIHHQYFQDYEDVTDVDNGRLSIEKSVYKVGKNDELIAVADRKLALGDRIRVRLSISTDRPMEFVQIQDDRPSGAEPGDLSSGYTWGHTISYYKSIKDVKTQFFIDFLEKGEYVLEYDMFINNVGEFTSGISEIQNAYAPEFNDYSGQITILVK